MASNPIQRIFFIKFIRYEVRQESSSEKTEFFPPVLGFEGWIYPKFHCWNRIALYKIPGCELTVLVYGKKYSRWQKTLKIENSFLKYEEMERCGADFHLSSIAGCSSGPGAAGGRWLSGAGNKTQKSHLGTELSASTVFLCSWEKMKLQEFIPLFFYLCVCITV